MCRSTNNKPISPFIPSHKLNNNAKVTTQVKRKLTYVFNVQSTLLNGRTVYALLYYIQIRFVLFYLFFIHALCNRYHNNIPKQAQEEGANVQSWPDRVVQAVDAFENKTDGGSQATATWDWDTYWWTWKRMMLSEWGHSSRLHEEWWAGGWAWGTWAVSWAGTPQEGPY